MTNIAPLPVIVPQNMIGQPFAQETETLFRCVSEHDFDTLAALCDDDFGIIDLGTEGQNVVIETRQEWEDWFHNLFTQLDTMNAKTTTEIKKYQAIKTKEMGYSVVDFCQILTVDGKNSNFNCVVTIIWKFTNDGWKESRWHCSLISVE